MGKKTNWMLYIIFLLVISTACNLFTSGLEQIDEAISQVEDITTEIAVDDIKDQLDSLSTDLPAEIENLTGDLDALITDLPSELDEIEGDLQDLTTDLPADLDDVEDELDALATEFPDELGDLGDLGGLLDDVLGSGEAPSDIPMVDDPKEVLVESEGLVSYLTPQTFDFVLSFYQEQMPLNGWEVKEGGVINEDTALLYYENLNQEVSIAISQNPLDAETAVTIIIQDK